jgi:hypothetical protein
LKLWADKVEKEKKMRDKLELMGKLNEESATPTDIGSAKPVTRNRLERTKSLKS